MKTKKNIFKYYKQKNPKIKMKIYYILPMYSTAHITEKNLTASAPNLSQTSLKRLG